MIGQELIQKLESIHNQTDSWIIKSPGRINIIGEHTDYNYGFCLPAAIELAVFMGLSPSDKFQINAWDRKESWNIVDTIRPDWAVYFKAILNYALKENLPVKTFSLDFTASLPSGAGLSSSSSITCGFLYALNLMNSWNIPLEQLTSIAVIAEKESGVEGGMMDQISIFNGSKDHALLIDCLDWSFKKIPILLTNYQWTIVDTKVKHKLIDSDYNNRSRLCKKIANKCANYFGIEENLRIVYEQYSKEEFGFLEAQEKNLLSYVIEENDRVKAMTKSILSQDISSIGSLLFSGHEGLRNKYQVSCPELDFLIDFAAKSSAAIGARMMGGGFGGSSLHLIKENCTEEFTQEISQTYLSKFGFAPDVYKADISNGVELINKK